MFQLLIQSFSNIYTLGLSLRLSYLSIRSWYLLLSLLSLLACDGDLTQANAPIISLSSTEILFTAPPQGTNESQFVLNVRNEGTADLIIVRTELQEKNQQGEDSEFAILDKDDWNNRLVIGAGKSKDLILSWRPLDANQDSAQLEIESNDGTVQVEITTVDLDPNLMVISNHPPITIEDGKESIVFTEAMYSGYQKTILEIRPDSPVPLILEEICLINDDGNCVTTYPTSDAFFICDTAEANLENCRPLPNELPVLEFDENYRFSIFFHVIDQRDSGFYAKLRIKSNASEQPDVVIQLKGIACQRDALNPICQKCGDGRVDDTEDCDDGNLIDLDGCGLNCKITEVACVEGKLGCPCQDGTCNLGFACDLALNLCVSCSGQVGCPCPCNGQSMCNEATGLCEVKVLDAFLDHDAQLDMGLDMTTDLGTDDRLDMTTDLGTNDRFDMFSTDMHLASDQGLSTDFSVDMMIDQILGLQSFSHSNLVLGAISHQSPQYQVIGVFSIGSSIGQTANYTIKSTLNP
jgi:cysteine-rich repeat protein